MNILLSNNRWRFVITLVLTICFSICRETDYSTLLKPLPILYWLIIAINCNKIKGGGWVIVSLSFAILGDILLDLGDRWLQLGSLPFLISTVILAFAFRQRLNNHDRLAAKRTILTVYAAVFSCFILLYLWISSYTQEAAIIGAVLYLISALLICTALNTTLAETSQSTYSSKAIIGFIGSCGIVANYVLYSIDLYVFPIPRDIVIQVYYWGTALVVWSFLKSDIAIE